MTEWIMAAPGILVWPILLALKIQERRFYRRHPWAKTTG